MRKFFGFKKDKLDKVEKEIDSKMIKEYKFKLKELICVNEELKDQLKYASHSLNNYKTYLAEIGISSKTNKINTSRNFNVKTINLIQKDNSELKNILDAIISGIQNYYEQIKEIYLRFELKNNISSENLIVEDQIFILSNLYMSKEAQITYLQSFIASFNNTNDDELYYEYHNFDNETVTCCMDHFMSGIRNEMAKTTRLLNIQKNMVTDNTKLIEEKKKELDELKHSKNSTPPTQYTNEVSNHNSNEIKPKKNKKNYRMKRDEKLLMIQNLTKELQWNFNKIDELTKELNICKNENEVLKEQTNNANIKFSNKYSEIYSLEMKLDKLKKTSVLK